jgi:hypothetical protein
MDEDVKFSIAVLGEKTSFLVVQEKEVLIISFIE